MREPGVIVNISGEELPPPLPETRYGIGFYVFARYGPYKPSFINIRNINKVYNGLNSSIDNELRFLLPETSIYSMLFPNLGVRSAVGFISLEESVRNNLVSMGYFNNNNRTTIKGRAIFGLPTWLNGTPRKVMVFDYSTSNPTPNISRISRLYYGSTNFINVEYTHNSFSSLPPITNYSSLDDLFAEISIEAYVHNNTSWLVWYRDNGYNHVIYKRNYTVNNTTNYQILFYTDDPSHTWQDITIEYLDSNNNTNSFVISSADLEVNLDLENAVYITKSYFNSSCSIILNANNEDILRISEGNLNLEFPISYSPLDAGYYGFIDSEYIEIIKNGDVYSHVLSSTPGNPVVVLIGDSDAYEFYSNIPFNSAKHEGRLPVLYFSSTHDIYSAGSYTITPSGPVIVGNVISSWPSGFNLSDYVISGAWLYIGNNLNMYSEWLNSTHDVIIYQENDVQRFTYSPIEVDLISDYGAKFGYAFTKFIRSHDKFMFKILGTPPMFSVPLNKRTSYAEDYWRLFDLGGFHYIRLQGHSTTQISPTTLYIRAVNSYGYQAIFGLNATLNLSEVDHEYKLAHRENLLDYRVNCIVKDRVLGLWYFNNNLTEEPRGDESPLGEENNSRTAIRLAKILAVFVERYIGEPNTKLTRERVVNEVSRFIVDFLASNRTNLVEFKVICDESNNTPADIANNRLNIRVEARFGKSIKYVVVFERVLMAE